jgi:hypothetical protein
MNNISEDLIKDLELAKKILSETDLSVVIIQNGKIWKQKKGDGVRPFLEIIDEMGNEINDSVIGDRILGKASALLCKYANASGVYSPQGTKTAIAILIIGGVPVQVDEMIPFITNRNKDGVCPFEKILENVEKPEEAYNILKEKLMSK